ncbi:ParB N-terminal domain-containing protein [Conexivisphaera calida]|uniref:ParB-like N-terminal domain-containing protein n=1 Tax=Conexivisphaera calida TaxID=1874277 RepID=A0A4V0P1K5_9ARCH|nr:ParB N-terminal domain-containing protein [Conexivisphaera calida]BBE42040.1 hypothetical protein NAS2_0651 [Conexivisphaera calida]
MASAAREIVEAPLEDCEPDPRFLYRVRYDVDDLVRSIRRGQIHPALAWRREDGKYMVFAGVRRLMAARAARRRYGEPRTFLVELVPPDTPIEEMWRLALDENVTQRKITPLDLVKAARSAPEGALRGVASLSERALKDLASIARRVTDEELEDVSRVEGEFNSRVGVERHLTFRQIAELVGLDRYTRIVAVWYFLMDPTKDVDDVRRAIRMPLIPDPLQKLLAGLEPPRFEEAGGAGSVQVSGGGSPGEAGEAGEAAPATRPEDAPAEPVGLTEPSGTDAMSAPSAPQAQPGDQATEPEVEGCEGGRVYNVLLGPDDDVFVFECPRHCGRVCIRIVRRG